MLPLVDSHGSALCEASTAEPADERLLPGVRADVRLQGALLHKALLTDGALEASTRCLGLLVRLHVAPQVEPGERSLNQTCKHN